MIVQHRRGTTDQWDKYKDEIIAAGEFVVEFTPDGSKIKVGDGDHKYGELPYITDKKNTPATSPTMWKFDFPAIRAVKSGRLDTRWTVNVKAKTEYTFSFDYYIEEPTTGSYDESIRIYDYSRYNGNEETEVQAVATNLPTSGRGFYSKDFTATKNTFYPAISLRNGKNSGVLYIWNFSLIEKGEVTNLLEEKDLTFSISNIPVVTLIGRIPAILEYAVKSVGDGYYATQEDMVQVVSTANAYADEKTSPATEETYGTVMVYTDVSNALVDTGIVHTNTSPLRIVPANELAIDGRVNEVAPIVPSNLDYAVKSVGDGYYITEEDIPKIIASNNADEGDIQEAEGSTLITPVNIEYAVKYIGDGYYALASDLGVNDTNAINTDNAIALGDTSIAGYMCHKVTAYDSTALTLTLDSSASTLAVKDVISIDGGNNYPYCATITAISGNTITVDKAIVDYKEIALDPSSETHLLYVDGKPNTGTNPLAEGQVAMGLGNHSIAKATTSFGRNNYASGGYSIAVGRDNTAANYGVALGRKNKAKGLQSVAIGFSNIVTAHSASAIGQQNTVTGRESNVIGRLNEVSGSSSFAAGTENVVTGTCASAVGLTNKSYGYGSFAAGFGNQASGGINNGETTKGAIALGLGCTTSGFVHGQTVVGRYNDYEAASNSATIFAVGNGSSEVRSTAFRITMNSSLILGEESTLASVSNSAVLGLGVQANANNQIVIGKYNTQNGKALFIVGNGNSASARSNAFTVLQDGSAMVQKMGSMYNSVVTKQYVDALITRIENLESKI